LGDAETGFDLDKATACSAAVGLELGATFADSNAALNEALFGHYLTGFGGVGYHVGRREG
jgi:hypothetical protein